MCIVVHVANWLRVFSLSAIYRGVYLDVLLLVTDALVATPAMAKHNAPLEKIPNSC